MTIDWKAGETRQRTRRTGLKTERKISISEKSLRVYTQVIFSHCVASLGFFQDRSILEITYVF
jgi:hypothetical protein